MNWKKEIILGMLCIQSACIKNTSYNECPSCPFYEHCQLLKWGPDEWEIETED